MMLSVMIPTVMGAPISNETDGIQEANSIQFTDKPLKIFVSDNNQNSFSSKLDKYTSKVEKVDELSELSSIVSSETMVVIDKDWASTTDVALVEKNVDRLVKNGNPVIVIDSSPELLIETGKDLGFTSFSNNAQVYAMWYSPQTGAQSCCSISGYDNVEDAITAAYKWADQAVLLVQQHLQFHHPLES